MTPRGIRNNNPGNIEQGENWKGLAKEQTDERFCTFSSMEYGCRALLKLLYNYITIHKCNTIELIISKYAPSNENNTEAYIKAVADRLKLGRKENIPLTKDNLIELARAIAKHENGAIAERIIPYSTWYNAFNLLGLKL